MLQHFFGLIRASGGCSTHPPATQFAQLFKLLMIYSLARPPRGSNVSGAETLSNLLGPSTLIANCSDEKLALEKKLDEIVDSGNFEELIDCENLPNDHDYVVCEPDVIATGYISGYVVRRCDHWAPKCQNCRDALIGTGEEEHNLLTKTKTKGYLKYSSTETFDFIYKLECIMQKVVETTDIHQHFLFDILEAFNNEILPEIGCSNDGHRKDMKKGMLKFYIIFRMYSYCDAKIAKYKKSKQLQKLARLAV